MRSALFRDFTQSELTVCYQCFGTTYRSHLRGSSSPIFLVLDCRRRDQWVVPKRR